MKLKITDLNEIVLIRDNKYTSDRYFFSIAEFNELSKLVNELYPKLKDKIKGDLIKKLEELNKE